MVKTIAQNFRKHLFFIFAAFLTYFYGSVLAGFEKRVFDWLNFFIGILFFLVVLLLKTLFDYLTTSKINPYTRVNFQKDKAKSQLFFLTMVLFVLFSFVVFALLQREVLIGVNLIYIVLITILMLISISRFGKTLHKNFSVIIEAMVVSPLMLLLGSGLQEKNPGPTMFLLTLPFFLLYLSTSIALLFESFDNDASQPGKSLLQIIGWENAIKLHNVSILFVYLFFMLYFYLTNAFSIYWTVLLAAFISIFEMFLLHRLAMGMKPNWNLIKATAYLQFFAITYLLIFPLL